MSEVEGEVEAGNQDVFRAEHLQHVGRYDDALEALRVALSKQPDSPELLRRMAHCQMNSATESNHALDTIERAIQLGPNQARSFALKSLILSDNHQGKQAIAPAEEAVSLDPDDAFGYAALAYAYLRSDRLADAETTAKAALALDPDEVMAANVLTHALFRQGKQAENQVQISSMLYQDPEDPYTHHSAGLAAMQAGDYAKAEEHFLEALRLRPNFEAARQGLLESFRARSPHYRAYHRYAFFMMRLTPGQRIGVFIGLWMAYNVVRRGLAQLSTAAYYGITALWILFVIWTFVARSVGSLMVMLDRRARHALTTVEKWDAVLVGGGVVAGTTLVAAGLIASQTATTMIGAGLIAMAIPLVMTLTNDHPKGKYLYGIASAVVILCFVLVLIGLTVPILAAGPALALGSLVTVVTMWLAMFGVWYR